MKILITGNKGFIGSHLHKLLPEADGLDIKQDYHSYTEDIRKCKLNKEYTHIFHLAALRSAPMGEEDPENFITTNCWGTVRLLKQYPNARFMNITSASAAHPSGVYGATKKFAEIMGSLYPNVINVRPYNVFGENQPAESKAVIPLFIKAILNHEKPVIYGDGQQVRDFTYVGDLVRELKRIMFDEQTPEGQIWHCGYAKPISINDLFQKIQFILGDGNATPEYKDKRSYDVQMSIAPYGIKEHYGREKGLINTCKWWQEQ